ncbi:MAG: choice-of-anchor tandem repeat GloVer-containing protein [Rhizomicrobium sp.]
MSSKTRLAIRWLLAFGILTVAFATTGASAGSFNVIYSFNGDPGDAGFPTGTLIADSSGNLYGTSQAGGVICNCGTIFKVAADGTESLLYAFCTFQGCSDGAGPAGKLLLDGAGNLYGAASSGGAAGYGTVFKLTPSGTESVLYTFCQQTNCTDGAYPQAGVISDADGNFYGTTELGGKYGGGIVFKVAPNGTETVLYSFCKLQACKDGAYPYSDLIMDTNGNLYGTTAGGGAEGGGCTPGYGCGTVFKLTPGGKETTLHLFAGGKDGFNPFGGLVADSSGNMFGTTYTGGGTGCSGPGCGIVFEITAAGVEKTFYVFRGQEKGDRPLGQLTLDSKGNLYGTTIGGGEPAYGTATAFRLTTKAKLTVLHDFCSELNCADGNNPVAGLLLLNNELYGVASVGGGTNNGVVYHVQP